MMFTSDRIRDLCPQPPSGSLDAFADALDTHAPNTLKTLLQRAHFIGQMAHESAGFKRFVENLNYSADRISAVWPRLAPRAAELAHNQVALGNAAYGGRMGNGPEESGDGFRYRGRGPTMLTGKSNYAEADAAIKEGLVSHPERAAEPQIGARIALWYWTSRKCSAAADADDVERVTRLINGGTNGLEERRRLTAAAKLIFTDPAEALIS